MGISEVFQMMKNSNLPKKKVTIFVSLGIVVALGVFLVGFFTGSHSYQHNEDKVKESFASNAALRELPPIKWNGNCPQKASKCPVSHQNNPPLILVSLDGLRSDYLQQSFTPTINKIAQCGAKADFLYPVFPTKTFPNHFSIVTGLYPPSHGIIDNSMYDPTRRKLFKLKDPEHLQPYWYQKEPIWVTATKQGKKTASFYWPGAEVKINGTLPTYNKKYPSRESFEERVDQILSWIDLPPSTRPALLMLYANQPDNVAHSNGPSSKQVNQALGKLDRMVERLFKGLQMRNLVGCVNVIILSDHGMSATNCKQVVDIQKHIDTSKVFSTVGPFGRLRPKGRHNSSAIDDVVSKLRCQSPHMRVYPKEQLPVRMHYADNARIEPIILDMDSKWTVVSKGALPNGGICSGGAHGYDNMYPDMRAIFLAHGPSFKEKVLIPPFINTELYELLCELIGIIPNPNNGTRGSLYSILRSPKPLPLQKETDPPTLATVPQDEKVYNDRVQAAECSCQQTTKQVNANIGKHLPFGVPRSPTDNSTLRLLHNSDYVTGFDTKYRIPMWTSFTLPAKINGVEKSAELCWTGDARISFSDSPRCTDYNNKKAQNNYIVQRPLYPPGFSDASTKVESVLVSNSLPKSLNHSKIIEHKMSHILERWVSEDAPLNVVMGPAFDLHATGVMPQTGTIMRSREMFGSLVVPTHIFVIATWCSTKVSELSECARLKTQAYLLPNHPYPNNCEPGESVIAKNVARIVDIEKLTGISFYTALSSYDSIRLRTEMPIVRT